jgi:hypothetical protein
MDSTTSWESIGELVDSLGKGAAIPFGAVQPTPAAILGTKLALRLLRAEGATLDPPPGVIATPWGTIVIWWRSKPQRRIEIVSRDEAYEFRESPKGTTFRRFMTGPVIDDAPDENLA